MSSKELNYGSLDGQSQKADTRAAIVRYLLIAPDGSGDAAAPISYNEAVLECMDMRDLAPILTRAMIADGIDVRDEDDSCHWLQDNAERIATANGYRFVKVLGWRK
jgi:hypothetical protein